MHGAINKGGLSQCNKAFIVSVFSSINKAAEARQSMVEWQGSSVPPPPPRPAAPRTTAANPQKPNEMPTLIEASVLESVSVPPNIDDSQSSSDTIVREGADVTLTCKASGSPPPSIRWKRDDNNKISINKTLSGESRDIFQLTTLGANKKSGFGKDIRRSSRVLHLSAIP
jgi:hypothetical protein